MNRSGSTVLASLKRVPPFPPVAVKLLGLLSDPAVEVKDVADLIASDATFTARLLQRVNSVEFARVTKIRNIRQAVAFLGLGPTRQIAVTHATGLYAKEALKTEELRRCWIHMVATAVLAEVIAEAYGDFVNIAFTAGIMHDIGRLGLLMAYPKEYENVISTAAAHCLDVLEFEAEEFGVHHAEAGRLLAEKWGLPEEFALVAGRHHDACEGEEMDLLRIVHVACRLADALGFEFVLPLITPDAAAVLAELPARARQKLQITSGELRSRVQARLREFDMTKTDLPPEESLAALSAAAEAIPETAASALVAVAPHAPAETPIAPRESGSTSNLAVIWAGVLMILAAAALFLWKLRG